MGLGIKRIRFNGDWYSKLLFQTNANKTIKNIVQVDSKSGRGLALDNNGKVWIWGGGSGGKELKISESQLKSNTVARFTTREATPKMINDISDVKEINCSGGRAIAVKNDGTVWTWLNEEIDKNKENKVLPIQVKELSDVKSADIIGVYDEDSYAAIALKMTEQYGIGEIAKVLIFRENI